MYENTHIITDNIGHLYAACRCGSDQNEGCRLDPTTEITLVVNWNSNPDQPTEIVFKDPIKLKNISSSMLDEIYGPGSGFGIDAQLDYPEHEELVRAILQKGDIASCGLIQHGAWHELPLLH